MLPPLCPEGVLPEAVARAFCLPRHPYSARQQEPAWAARKETPAPVHPGDAAQPVSEGLDKTERQVVIDKRSIE